MVNNVSVVMVVAASQQTRAIGQNNQLLWHIPADLQRFKALTLGHPIIMGRKTFESIVAMIGKPLPQRTNIVVTRNSDFEFAGVRVTHSLEEAFAVACEEHPTEIHIGGGSNIYTEALPYVDRLYVTWVDTDIDGDAHLPMFENEFVETHRSEIQNHNGISYTWVDYQRKAN